MQPWGWKTSSISEGTLVPFAAGTFPCLPEITAVLTANITDSFCLFSNFMDERWYVLLTIDCLQDFVLCLVICSFLLILEIRVLFSISSCLRCCLSHFLRAVFQIANLLAFSNRPFNLSLEVQFSIVFSPRRSFWSSFQNLSFLYYFILYHCILLVPIFAFWVFLKF